MRFRAALALFALCARAAFAGDVVMPPGSDACEADWMTRQPQVVPSLAVLRRIESAAEEGNVAAQLRLGMARRTADGQWTAPADGSYSVRWLEAAVAKGSKSAEAELATIQWFRRTRPIDHRTYVSALIRAALEDRNPWIASDLMNYTRGRWGSLGGSKGCAVDDRAGACNGLDLLPPSDTRKWAEIAAEGGNPVAQGWLCQAADYGDPEHGQPKDPAAAYRWCLIAAHNACAFWPPSHLADTPDTGSGLAKDAEEAERWRAAGHQPWRTGAGFFFSPAY